MASGYSPRWRRFLQRHVRFLFTICIGGNYHWKWDRYCYCCWNEYFGNWRGGRWDLWRGQVAWEEGRNGD
jgi:hypothetical protein